MVNSTETFWDVDGVSLQTFAFNIVTLGGDRESARELRGSNIVVPYAPGERHVAKVVGAHTVTLGMWVIGATEDGLIPTEDSARRQYDDNWRKLRRLLWTPRRQFILTKRFWLPTADLVAGGVDVSGLPVDGSYSLYSASAKGQFAGGLVPVMSGPARASFTVDIDIADSFFFGDVIETEFSTAPAGGSNPGPLQTIEVLGDERTTWIELELVGPVTSATLTNESAEGNLWVRYASVVPANERAVVRAYDFSATQYPVGDPYKASGYVNHDGDKFWLYLDPGEQVLRLTVSDGTGTAKLRYRPVWF